MSYRPKNDQRAIRSNVTSINSHRNGHSPVGFLCSASVTPNPSPSFQGIDLSLTLSFSDECFSLFGACLWKDSRKQGTLINSVIWGEGGSAEERQTFLTDVKSFLELLNL